MLYLLPGVRVGVTSAKGDCGSECRAVAAAALWGDTHIGTQRRRLWGRGVQVPLWRGSNSKDLFKVTQAIVQYILEWKEQIQYNCAIGMWSK